MGFYIAECPRCKVVVAGCVDEEDNFAEIIKSILDWKKRGHVIDKVKNLPKFGDCKCKNTREKGNGKIP